MTEPPEPTRRRRVRVVTRASLIRLAGLGVILIAATAWAYFTMLRMPGESYTGPLAPLDDGQRTAAERMRADVEALAGGEGRRGRGRNVMNLEGLDAAAGYLDARLTGLGYTVRRQVFKVSRPDDFVRGAACCNLEAERRGTATPERVVIIGAHYDSFDTSPGANDNASGVAAVLELARRFADRPRRCTVRFVLFANEEPPFFRTPDMGSVHYARRVRERGDAVEAMISVETIGWYDDTPGSQAYPAGLAAAYPDRGNFIGLVSNVRSRELLRRIVGTFRAGEHLPSEGAALFGGLPGVGWSDHWAFWQEGYPAIMVTDTAPFRYPHYHRATDTPDRLDYDRMVRVVDGLEAVLVGLADG